MFTQNSQQPDQNATASWDQDLGMELLRAKRPKGVDDFVEGIPQAQETDWLRQGPMGRDESVYPAYDSGTSDEGGVGSKIGLEKVVRRAIHCCLPERCRRLQRKSCLQRTLVCKAPCYKQPSV